MISSTATASSCWARSAALKGASLMNCGRAPTMEASFMAGASLTRVGRGTPTVTDPQTAHASRLQLRDPLAGECPPTVEHDPALWELREVEGGIGRVRRLDSDGLDSGGRSGTHRRVAQTLQLGVVEEGIVRVDRCPTRRQRLA